MKPGAIEHAKSALVVVEASVVQMKAAKDFSEFSRAWSALLQAAAKIYAKLGQGAEGNGKAKAWMGRKMKQRKDDPLLCYIHHARNSDYHSIDDVTSGKGTLMTFRYEDGMTFSIVTDSDVTQVAPPRLAGSGRLPSRRSRP